MRLRSSELEISSGQTPWTRPCDAICLLKCDIVTWLDDLVALAAFSVVLYVAEVLAVAITRPAHQERDSRKSKMVQLLDTLRST